MPKYYLAIDITKSYFLTCEGDDPDDALEAALLKIDDWQVQPKDVDIDWGWELTAPGAPPARSGDDVPPDDDRSER